MAGGDSAAGGDLRLILDFVDKADGRRIIGRLGHDWKANDEKDRQIGARDAIGQNVPIHRRRLERRNWSIIDEWTLQAIGTTAERGAVMASVTCSL